MNKPVNTLSSTRQEKVFHISPDASWLEKALQWASTHTYFNYFNPNNTPYHGEPFVHLLTAGSISQLTCSTGNAFEELKNYYEDKKDWLVGHLAYDLKNEIESLTSTNEDIIKIPELHFYQPEHLVFISKNEVKIISTENPDAVFDAINHSNPTISDAVSNTTIRQKINRATYLDTVSKLKEHIVEGDIYEINYCMEFYAKEVNIDPLSIYQKLNSLSPMPFSTLYRCDQHYLIGASPERFIKKSGQKLLTQPIKGTAPRGKTPGEDADNVLKLKHSEKERAENMMIVDLVRNDLARSCESGSIRVEELFKIYTFPQVHQMISSVSGRLRDSIHFIDAIKNAFPMGSMTGAPKIRAMELIEEHEQTRRGLFSGTVGYITPDGDFDFNVVIRSILYDNENKNLSFQVGSAITYDAEPEQEYEECLVKVKSMLKSLSFNH